MGWATKYIEALQQGKTISFRPKGSSMSPKIESGQLVTVAPLVTDPWVGDIVLCRVRGNEYLHLVKAIDGSGGRFQIANNRGHVNGWVSRAAIFGRCVLIEP